MTNEEIDILWQKATTESIKNGEIYTRYRFAKMVEYAEREAMKPAIIEACKMHTREMEGYSYFGSNPGVCEDDYEDVANDAAAIRARGNK